MNKTVAAAISALYLGSIIAANWAIAHVGSQPFPGGPHVLPVGFGLDAPSGVYIVGLTLVLRDLVQRQVGKPATFALIAIGALISATFAPSLAVASGVAFLASETVDFAVFSATERFGLLRAVALSNAVSVVVDSLVFLSIAFGSLAFIEGQIVGKVWATIAGLVVLAAVQARRSHLAAT